MVTVISGPNGGSFQLAGRSVASIRADFSSPYNLSADYEARLNGQAVEGTATVSDGDKLVFTLPTGEKG